MRSNCLSQRVAGLPPGNDGTTETDPKILDGATYETEKCVLCRAATRHVVRVQIGWIGKGTDCSGE